MAQASTQSVQDEGAGVVQIIGAIATLITLVLGAVGLLFVRIMREIRTLIPRVVGEALIEQNHFIDQSVRKMNGGLLAVLNSFEGPCWIRSASVNSMGLVEFRMQDMNGHAERAFGIDRIAYIGKTDVEAGRNRDEAMAASDADSTVWASGVPRTFIEKIGGTEYRVRRLRVESRDNVIKGVMCMVMPQAAEE